MKRNGYFITVLLFFLIGMKGFSQSAPPFFDVDLWENGLPNTNGADQLPYDIASHNFKPFIRVFLPEKENAIGRAVVACPGGGYHGLAYDYEGTDWASYFNEQGIALIVLSYRMPKGINKDVPISDAEQAMRIVRQQASEWNINPHNVGIMGSSAGGHLASTIATHAAPELRPDFQILFYPVITMDKSYTDQGTHDNLLGKEASREMEILYSNEKQIDSTTPRAFIAFSDDDRVVSPMNGILYYSSLKKMNIPASLYIYPSGGHGWGIGDGFVHKKEMLADLTGWLRSF